MTDHHWINPDLAVLTENKLDSLCNWIESCRFSALPSTCCVNEFDCIHIWVCKSWLTDWDGCHGTTDFLLFAALAIILGAFTLETVHCKASLSWQTWWARTSSSQLALESGEDKSLNSIIKETFIFMFEIGSQHLHYKISWGTYLNIE